MKAASDMDARHRAAWHRQPVLWLGIVIFVASLAGCVWMIVLGVHHADTSLDTSPTVFGVPVGAHGNPSPPPVEPPR